jgi:SOS-response transcriptional repressor LexA
MLSKEELNRAIGLRLKEFRQSLGATSREFAASAGQHQASFAMVEAGRNLFSMHVLSRLVEIYGLNANWLLTGYGSTKIPPLVGGKPMEAPPENGKPPYELVDIPILSTFLSLGEPVEQAGEHRVDIASVIKPLVPHPRHTYGLHARGDSMDPVIKDKYLVLVDTHEDAIRPYENLKGHPVAVRIGEGVSVKWMDVGKNDWVIYAENKDCGFKDVRISRQVDPPVVGRVIWWCPSV